MTVKIITRKTEARQATIKLVNGSLVHAGELLRDEEEPEELSEGSWRDRLRSPSTK
jgi:hypothetical protein